MPAKSKAQQRFMGMVRAKQKGKLDSVSKEVSDAAKSIDAADAEDYAETKHKGLPEKKGRDMRKVAYLVGYMAAIKQGVSGKSTPDVAITVPDQPVIDVPGIDQIEEKADGGKTQPAIDPEPDVTLDQNAQDKTVAKPILDKSAENDQLSATDSAYLSGLVKACQVYGVDPNTVFGPDAPQSPQSPQVSPSGTNIGQQIQQPLLNSTPLVPGQAPQGTVNTGAGTGVAPLMPGGQTKQPSPDGKTILNPNGAVMGTPGTLAKDMNTLPGYSGSKSAGDDSQLDLSEISKLVANISKD